MKEFEEVVSRAEKLAKDLVEETNSAEEAIAVCEIAQSILMRSASQYDILQGKHLEKNGKEEG